MVTMNLLLKGYLAINFCFILVYDLFFLTSFLSTWKHTLSKVWTKVGAIATWISYFPYFFMPLSRGQRMPKSQWIFMNNVESTLWSRSPPLSQTAQLNLHQAKQLNPEFSTVLLPLRLCPSCFPPQQTQLRVQTGISIFLKAEQEWTISLK